MSAADFPSLTADTIASRVRAGTTTPTDSRSRQLRARARVGAGPTA